MNEQLNDSTNAASKGSSDGPPPILPGTTSTQPGPDDENMNGNTGSASSSGLPSSGPAEGRQVSSKKTEANRKNAQKSTGPRTESGKAKAAANSYKHGFFARRLFLNIEQWAKDKADYETVANGFYQYYQPVGFMENFWVEKAATEALRLARLIQHEQKVLDRGFPFELRSPDSLLRYQAVINRQLVQAIEQIERLQANRKAEANPPGQPSPAAASTAEEREEPTAAPDDQTDEQPTSSAVTVTEPHGEQSEPSASDAAPRENCRTDTPPAAGGEPTVSSTQEIPGDRSEAQAPDRLSTGSPQQGLSGGTNPPRKTLADIVEEAIDDEDLDIY